MIKPDMVLKLSHKFRLQWEESQQNHVLLYAEGMVKLNESAAEILQLCNNDRSVKDIVDALVEKYQDTSLQTDVMTFLDEALDKGWLISTNSH
jgi:pyrroloquinoline quinone biosynthesis protein D